MTARFPAQTYSGGRGADGSALENCGERRLDVKTWRIAGLTVAGLAIGAGLALQILADKPARPGDVTEARIAAEAADGKNWLLNGRTFDAKHFSPLTQITDKNANALGWAWCRSRSWWMA